MTYDDSSMKVFLNGNQDGAAAAIGSLVPNSGNTTRIGWDAPGYNQYFNGFIDDARVYNRALSPAEIQAIYNAER